MIKNFLDSDEESSGTAGTADSSIFGSLNDSPAKAAPPAADLDPFAASDYHIEPAPQISSEPEPVPFRSTTPVGNEPFAYIPPTPAESSKMWGLAFTAGIAFVSSVVFMLLLGWLVDTFIGTAPWGIVGGIVLGSIIGFIQFFRLNSQILNSSKTSQPTSFLDLGEQAPAPAAVDHAPPPESDNNKAENFSASL